MRPFVATALLHPELYADKVENVEESLKSHLFVTLPTLQENLVFVAFGFATISSKIATITFCGNLKTCYKVATDTVSQKAIMGNYRLPLNIKLLWQNLICHNYQIATIGHTL